MERATRRWGGFALAVILCVAAYHLSLLGLFFLVPLEWVRRKWGVGPLGVAAILALAGIVAGEWVIKSLVHSEWTTLDFGLLGFPIVLVFGWLLITGMERWRWRFLYRLLLVTATTGVVLFPVFAWLLGQDSVNVVIRKAFDQAWAQVFQTPGVDVPGFLGKANPTDFFELLKQAFLGSFLLVFFLLWGFTGRMARFLDPSKGPSGWKEFFLPPEGAWALLGLWGVILLQGLLQRVGVSWDWGFAQYVVLNAAWVVLVVHGMAGWGILHSWMDRWHWPRFSQSAVRVLLVLLVLIPGAGQLVVLAGLPILAVLELWVNFRRRRQGVGL